MGCIHGFVGLKNFVKSLLFGLNNPKNMFFDMFWIKHSFIYSFHNNSYRNCGT